MTKYCITSSCPAGQEKLCCFVGVGEAMLFAPAEELVAPQAHKTIHAPKTGNRSKHSFE
jgi:hypothetical protein